VHLALYPRDTRAWARRLSALRRREISVSWDFGWNDVLAKDPGLTALIDTLTVVFVNEREAALYSGAADFDAALPFWRARRPIVVIKLGAQGSRVVGHAGEWAAPAPNVTAVDTTGAGDAFNGGFLSAWMRGASLVQALRLGNRIGAASTRKAGGIEALPRLVRERTHASEPAGAARGSRGPRERRRRGVRGGEAPRTKE
jgi:sugar/nucleoside kinase (ribokinase family)